MADSNYNNSTIRKPKSPGFGQRAGRPAPKSPAVTIAITKEIIETAKPRNSQHCMIAETIARTVPNARNVLVDTATIRWTDLDKGLRYIYLTPQSVRRAIFLFDDGAPIEPFSFHLHLAQVRGVKARDGAKKRITLASWQDLKDKIRKIGTEKGLKLGVIAKQIGVVRSTLYSDYVPTVVNVGKIEKWVLAHTGEKPAPRVTSRANRASGPARLRGWNPKKREQPELIGGAHPPVDINLAMRQYGLRKLKSIWGDQERA